MNKSEVFLLKNITTKIGSGSTPTGGQNAYHESGISLIRSQNVLDFVFSTNGLAFINEEQAKVLEGVSVEENDILLNITGDSIARACIVPKHILPARVNQHVSIIRCKQGISSHYVFFYLQYLKPYLLKICRVGGTRNALTKEAIEKLQIVLPNYIIQQNNASILSALDSKIALNNRINTELEAMAKTLYDYWFVQFDFPFDFAQGKPSAEGKPYKSSGGKMVWNEELKREIPEGWEVGTLSDLGDIVGGSTPPRDVNEYFSNNGTAWITPKDLSLNKGNKFITKGELDVSESGIKVASLNIMPKGTILLSSRAPIGYLAISRNLVTTNQGFKSFVTNKGYSTEYVYYTIKNMIPAIENNAVGSTFKEISATTLKLIKVCIAKKEIVEAFNKKVTQIFKRQDLIEQENLHLSSLRDWLLPMLMNGQVVSTTLNNREE